MLSEQEKHLKRSRITYSIAEDRMVKRIFDLELAENVAVNSHQVIKVYRSGI